MSKTDYQKQVIAELLKDFPKYAESSLKIRTKKADIKPLQLNKAQLYLHKKLEEQKKLTGKVRAIILKGRQQGCSTYVAARYYHQITQQKGAKCFILTHRDDATANLYKLVKRYHDNLPLFLKPNTGVSNAKELYFDELDSGYAVGTAGGGTVGRSDTIQLLHGSEVAFWQNTSEISSGIMQTVPDEAGTEIILESTANGMGNMYHKMAIKAMQGLSDYQLIFIPWYWEDGYRAELPEDFELTEEEAEYKRVYKLDDRQIAWRRNKIANLDGGEWQFKQEYPATIIEAFQTSNDDSIISPKALLKARKSELLDENNQPLIIGVDPAGAGKDRTAIVWRRGRNQLKSEIHKKWDTNQIVGRLVQIINNNNPDKIFIDLGYNPGIYDNMKLLGWGKICVGVNFGSQAEDPERYPNKRCEMWFRMADWVKDEPCKIEDSEELFADLTCVKVKRLDNRGRVLLMSKEDIKKEFGLSPDLGDALALTFAFNVPNAKIKEMYGIGAQQVQAPTNWNVF